MNKKYELIPTDTKIVGSKTLYRIKSLIDFTLSNGKKIYAGDLGGYIENENNLSHAGNAWVYDNARVSGNARVYGDAWVCDNARVSGNADILTISNVGSRGGTTTFFRTADNSIRVKCGCFSGTIDEFAAAVENTHGNNKYGQEYRIAIQLAKLHIGNNAGGNDDEQNT